MCAKNHTRPKYRILSFLLSFLFLNNSFSLFLFESNILFLCVIWLSPNHLITKRFFLCAPAGDFCFLKAPVISVATVAEQLYSDVQ